MWANYLRKLAARIKAILATPQTEWKVIAQEHDTLFDLLISYVAILAAIPEVAHFIGQSFIGGYTPVVPNFLRAVVVYLITFAMVYIIAGVIDLLAPRFGGEKNFANAVKLSAYSHTPLWLAGIFLLVPGLNFLLILGLYGFYLLWIGLPMLMKVPHEKALPYVAAVTAWVLIGRIGSASPNAGVDANLDSITAVVIGGTSLFGGRGSIVGTLIGALIVGVFRSAVSLAGLDVLWQEFAIGVLIIIAVALDQWIRRVSA